MSNENNEPNSDTNNDQNHPRRRRKRNRRRGSRTIRWYHDSSVGTELHKQNVVLKFFISVAENETPEIFFIPMHRELVQREDGSIGMKPIYAGDIEKNAVPLSILDLKSMWDSLVTMKARLLRMQEEHRGGEEKTIPIPEVPPEVFTAVKETARAMAAEEAARPKRSQKPTQPLMHRMSFPPGVVARAPASAEPPAQPETKAPTPSLADALQGW